MEMPELDHYIKVKHSKRARRVGLRFDVQDRVVYLVVPKRASMKTAYKFAQEHESWIREKIDTLPPLVPYEHGRIIPLLGENMTLDITYDPTLKRTDIKLIEHSIFVKTNKEDPSSRIEQFFIKLARERLSKLAHEKAASIDKKIRDIQIRDTKSRWGSCGEEGQISLSWRLIFAPYLAMDYVVAHEVAHLVHLNHSKAFWNVCRNLSDDFLEGEYWMQNHGQELMRYGKN